jgi:hypothetical protein
MNLAHFIGWHRWNNSSKHGECIVQFLEVIITNMLEPVELPGSGIQATPQQKVAKNRIDVLILSHKQTTHRGDFFGVNTLLDPLLRTLADTTLEDQFWIV